MAVEKMQLDYSLFFFSLNILFYFEFCNCNSATASHGNESVHGSKKCVFCFTELLHIPPGSKDAAVFSPGGDKGSAAAPGEPACHLHHFRQNKTPYKKDY
jgi:hypothetical protein